MIATGCRARRYPPRRPSAARARPARDRSAITWPTYEGGIRIRSPISLALSARFGKDAGAIPAGLVWRIYAERPDPNGSLRLMKEDRTATPNVVLPPGNYVVHAAYGFAGASRRIAVQAGPVVERLTIGAGA